MGKISFGQIPVYSFPNSYSFTPIEDCTNINFHLFFISNYKTGGRKSSILNLSRIYFFNLFHNYNNFNNYPMNGTAVGLAVILKERHREKNKTVGES